MTDERKEALKKQIESIAELETLSSIIRDIMRVCANENSTVEDFERVVERDYAISSKLLAISNSAFYGFPRQIKTINQAIMVLGFDMAKGLAIATAVFNDISAGDRKTLMHFWRHSFYAAATAGLIADRTELVNKGTAFIAGLLHDIGRPILYKLFGGAYIETSLTAHGSLVDVEAQSYGAAHPQAGAWFAEKCMMPYELIEAIKLHHSPDPKGSSLVAAIYAADLVVSTGSESYLSDSIISPRHFEVLRLIGLDAKSLDSVSEEFESMREDMEAFCR
jgi:putative nucleotidyltransferase with HDIG domain